MKSSLHLAILPFMWAYQFSTTHCEPKVEKNRFGDLIIITEKDPSIEQVSKTIEDHSETNKPIFIHIPNNDITEYLIAKGFCEFHSNNEKRILVKRVDQDDVPPAPFTCNAGAKVLITRKINNIEHVLFTLEERPEGKCYFWPGGMSRPGEKTLITALRELKEEVSIDIAPEKVRFLGVLQKQYGGHGAMHHQYVYHVPYEGQEIKPDGKEVLDVLWIPIKKVLEEKSVLGKPIEEHKLQILRDIYNGKEGTPCVHILDPRKQHKSESARDDNDIMDFHPATS